MRGRLSRRTVAVASGLAVAAAGVTIASAASAAAAPAHAARAVPIAANQFFRGRVNGTPPGKTFISVVCAAGKHSGHPAPNQTISVALLPHSETGGDVGFTGGAGNGVTSYTAWNLSVANLVNFTDYGTQPFPTNITLPCSGRGVVRWVVADATARQAQLDVTFKAVSG